MHIKEALSWAIDELKKANVSEPKASALILMGDVLNLTRSETLANIDCKLSVIQFKKFKAYIRRRKKHESVWHIIGKVPFWGLEFIVNKDVLVPRPETEILVEEAVNAILGADKKPGRQKVLDVGTGSGTIAIALAAEFPEVKIIATDVSKKALSIARKNATKNGLKNIKFIRADLFNSPYDNGKSIIKDKYDVICANLPYIPKEDMDSLSLDIHHYEPRLALDGGKKGLEIYENFLRQAEEHLENKGKMFCEIGIGQGDEFKKMVRKYLPKRKCIIKGDLADIDRVAIIFSN
jgi:release factor glutamine methyltransferase